VKEMRYIVIILVVLSGILNAEIPQGYYDSASGLSGAELKAALHEIINNHTEFPYTSYNTDVWDILKVTDKDTENADNVNLLYTGWSVNGAQEYNNGNGWSREHVWAKSHGDFGTTMGAGTDVHHLRPCDISVNSARGNKDFDNGGTEYIDPDGATGCYSDSDSWEPRDAVKGDLARMIFYMAVRYEGGGDEPDLELVNFVNSSPEPEHGKYSALIQWHEDDAVDSWEINRNDIIYNDYQGNRNPFIDHPEYASQIWSGTGEVLPVVLSVFTVNITNNVPCIYWRTESESGNAGWNIYRGESENSIQNEETLQLNIGLGLIEGAGTTSEPTEYNFTDLFYLVNGENYFYWIESVEFSGNTEIYGPVSITSMEEEFNPNTTEIPKKYGLKENFPNPFNPGTTIIFCLEEYSYVEMTIYNVKGEKVATLLENEYKPEGDNFYYWNGLDAAGKKVATGTYFIEMKTEGTIFKRKLTLVK